MSDRLAAHRPPASKNLPALACCAIGVVIVAPLLLIGVLGSLQPGAPPDSGLARCTSLSSAHYVAASDYPKIRAQFAGSRWADLRTVGTAYTDLAMQLRHAVYSDGYETVWSYQRLSAACPKHKRALDVSACQHGYARHLMPGNRPIHADRTARTCEAVSPSASAVALLCRDRARCPERDSRRPDGHSGMLRGALRISGSVLLGGSEILLSW